MERYIGGEFWYDDTYFCSKRQIEGRGAYFLSGGQACLQIICDYMKEHVVDSVLLPEYLCPTVLDCFDKNQIKYSFYNIGRDFKIDIKDLREKSRSINAIFYINYFGFLRTEEEVKFLLSLKAEGKLIIEDNVQIAFNCKKLGNFSFNSFRKFVPYDGGYLYSDYCLDDYINKYLNRGGSRLLLVRKAREEKKQFAQGIKDNECQYLETFRMAEQAYYNDVSIKGDSYEQDCIEHLNWNEIIRIRRENYKYVAEELAEFKNIEVINPELQLYDIPLGLPVYVKEHKRDIIKHELAKRNVFLPIHWDIRSDIRFEHNIKAVNMSKQILSIVIDQRYGLKEMDYIVQTIKLLIGE